MRRRCLSMVHELARVDERVVFIGSDLGAGTLSAMKEEFPERFFMEGIAEQNLVGIAAGLALEGFIPFVNTIATFLTRRSYEQIVTDVCLHRLPVVLIGNGGGVVYGPLGPTHQATEDISIMRSIPNMSVVAPCDAEEMGALMQGILEYGKPLYIRLAKGGDPIVPKNGSIFGIGHARKLRGGVDVSIMTYGAMVAPSLEAAGLLSEVGIECDVINVHTVKPLDHKAISESVSDVKLLLIVEEHSRVGGLCAAVCESLIQNGKNRLPLIKHLSLDDQFQVHYGSQKELLENSGLSTPNIVETVKSLLQ